jgi:hypothetical protein
MGRHLGGTIGHTKMQRFPTVNVVPRAGRTAAPPWSGNEARDVASREWNLLDRGRQLFQWGQMRPTPKASMAARARRARAASHMRCRNIQRVSAIRLPPGSVSKIAEYSPSSRAGRARRDFQLEPRGAIPSSRVLMSRRPASGQIECPNWRASRVREMSPRTTAP